MPPIKERLIWEEWGCGRLKSSGLPNFWSVPSALSLMGIAQAAVAQEAPAGGEASGDEIVVTGIRASLAASADIKREAQGVVDAISAEDIGKFPDTNLAESLQRITGVSIDRQNGEGSAGHGSRLRSRIQPGDGQRPPDPDRADRRWRQRAVVALVRFREPRLRRHCGGGSIQERPRHDRVGRYRLDDQYPHPASARQSGAARQPVGEEACTTRRATKGSRSRPKSRVSSARLLPTTRSAS